MTRVSNSRNKIIFMCAINPSNKKRFIIDVYTSVLMEDFDERVMTILLETEVKLNSEHGTFRFHIKESQDKAD